MVHTARPADQVTDAARALHQRATVIDGCSFFLRGDNDRLRASGLSATNFTVVLPWDDLGTGVARIAEYYDAARRDARIEIAWSAADIERCKREGKFAAIVGCQNSRVVGTELANVEVLWRLGMRVMQLTYNERNFAADGCLEPDDAGLSFFGRTLIRELNRWGLVLDLAHCGVRSSLEAIEASQQPVIISHAGIRALVDSPRALSDEQIRAVAQSGGVVGVTTFAPFNWRGGPDRPRLSDFLDAVEHAVAVAGVDHVGFGTDHVVEPGGYPQWVRDRSAEVYTPYSPENAERGRRFAAVTAGVEAESQLEGMDGLQHLPRVTQGLLERGFSEDDVARILGGNFLRVFQQVWRTSAPV
jgi:membrane dipeptidase